MALFSPKHADGDRLQIAGASVRLRVNPRARRVSLRLDRAKCEVVAVAPSVRRLGEVVAFANAKQDWIAAQIAALPASHPFTPGQALTLFGKPAVLGVTTGRPRRLADPTGGPDRIVAPAKDGDGGEAWRAAILRLLKREALAGLTAKTLAYSAALGQPDPTVAVADARSRWGSCKPARRGRQAAIRYSWRVMLAPEAIADYLCAHETAHLVQPNHSPAFWAVVADLNGDHSPHRAWLRRHGAMLHGMG
jgi:predicted metal-dependent hydrolase